MQNNDLSNWSFGAPRLRSTFDPDIINAKCKTHSFISNTGSFGAGGFTYGSQFNPIWFWSSYINRTLWGTEINSALECHSKRVSRFARPGQAKQKQVKRSFRLCGINVGIII